MRNNKQPNEWPLRTIKDAVIYPNNLDSEPHAQRLHLDCGHWLVHTFGDRNIEYHTGDKVRCRDCYTNERMSTR